MNNNAELLHDLTGCYLKSLISGICSALSSDCDSFAPFGELGIDSFHVLKIIKRLEEDFGILPKSLLFEHFNIHDLTTYFVERHEKALSARFAERLQSDSSVPHNGAHLTGTTGPAETIASAIVFDDAEREPAEPLCIPESELHTRPEVQRLVQVLFERY